MIAEEKIRGFGRQKRNTCKKPSKCDANLLTVPEEMVKIGLSCEYAALAQQVEHFHGKEGVDGSNPLVSSICK